MYAMLYIVMMRSVSGVLFIRLFRQSTDKYIDFLRESLISLARGCKSPTSVVDVATHK